MSEDISPHVGFRYFAYFISLSLTQIWSGHFFIYTRYTYRSLLLYIFNLESRNFRWTKLLHESFMERF